MSDGLKNLIQEANKKYGNGTLKFGNEVLKNIPILCSTGSLKLDLAIGCGGLPKGRIMEMFGPPSGGKTTLSLHAMREAQKSNPDKVVAFIDLENSFDRSWADAIGIDTEKILYHQPGSGDEALDLAEMMIKSKSVSLIVIDSVSAMVTKAEIEAEYSDAMMAQTARLMSMGLKKINACMIGNDCSLIFVNQIRMKIGGYGNPEEATGGMALKFYSSIRFEVRRGEVIGEKTEPIGFVTKIKNVKNKVGPPFRVIETELYIGPERFGIDTLGEVADLSVVNGMVEKGGAWFKYNFKGQDLKWQGRDNFINELRNNKELYDELYNLVSKTVLLKDAPVVGSFADITKEQVKEEIVEEQEVKKRGRKKKDENVVEELVVPVVEQL